MKRREIPVFPLRLDPGLKERAGRYAARYRHTMTVELEMLIEEALDARDKKEQAKA